MSLSLPSMPPRQPRPGFLYLPPYRLQGFSIAGEATCMDIPELSLAFDIGCCPRSSLSCEWLALSHGHMDHAASLAYWCSQKHFLGMRPGKIICHPQLADKIHMLMRSWIGLERQRTPYELIPLAPGKSISLRGNMHLEAFKTPHTPNSLGFTVYESRSKLKAHLQGLSQEEIIAHKQSGDEVTDTFEHVQVTYTGDTGWGAHLETERVLQSRVLIAECTFSDPGDMSRAKSGKHLHVGHLKEWLPKCQAEHVVLVHISRRQNMKIAREQIEKVLGPELMSKCHLLMDGRTNRERWGKQCEELGIPVDGSQVK